jgi:hypothetical protein
VEDPGGAALALLLLSACRGGGAMIVTWALPAAGLFWRLRGVLTRRVLFLQLSAISYQLTVDS